MKRFAEKERVAVAQLGARRHYAVPLAFAAGNRLDRFFTDVYLASPASRAMLAALNCLVPLPCIRRLRGRYAPGLPPDRVVDFPLFSAQYKWRCARQRRANTLAEAWIWGGREFCREVVRSGLLSSTIVYAYSSAALEIFEFARASGMSCVLDHATAPRRYEDRLVEESRLRHADWFPGDPPDPFADEYARRQAAEWGMSDKIICNSRFVQNAICAEGGGIDKTVVVPLGLSHTCHAPVHTKVRVSNGLRVLFVGDDGVRKGIGDLAEASKLLRLDRSRVRAVGDIRLSKAGWTELRRVITFPGKIPRAEMAEQYNWADVFVLPSVSDTFGLAVLEAMARGVPVIVSRNTGAADVVRPGLDGYIISPGCPNELAEKLDMLASDSSLRLSMSEHARGRAAEYSIDRYSQGLLDAVKGCTWNRE